MLSNTHRPLLVSFVLSTVLALPAGCATPAASSKTAPAAKTTAAKPATAAPAASGSSVVRATLANGLRVVIVPSHFAPVATMEINYLVGSNETPKGFPGTAHAQEHMMFRGSPGLTADQLAGIIAGLGGDMNADTQQTVTQYFFTVPAEDLDVVLHVGALRMKGVDDAEKAWDKERGAIEQEVSRDNSSPSYVMYSKLLAMLFKGTPYAHDALGTRPSFDKTTGAALKAFHDEWYAPNNAIMVIAGDVDAAKVLPKVKKLFGGIGRREIPARPEVKLQPVKPQTIALTTDQPYGLVLYAFRLPGYRSKDFAATQVLGDVLDSHRGPIFALRPEGKAIWAGFETDLSPETGIGFAYAVFPKGADTKALAASLKTVVDGAVKTGFQKDMVQAAARSEATQAELEKNSVSGLAQTWSQALAVEGRSSPEDDVKAMQSVTVADVDSVAKRYVDTSHAILAVLTPQPSGKPVAAKGFGGAESFASSKTKGVKLPDWAKHLLAKLPEPHSTLHPVASTLPNGLTLIVQPVAASDTVSVYGRVKEENHLEAPKGKMGVDRVLQRMFDYGTTTLDRIAYQRALDEIGAEEQTGTDFSVKSLSSHFDRATQLLADAVLHPALPAKRLPLVLMQVMRTIAGRNQSPSYLARRAIDMALTPPKDPKRRQATPASVKSITLADVTGYYHTVFRPDLTTIVVIGKVDPAKAKAVVTKYFGGWKATGKRPATDLPKIAANEPSSTVVPDSSRSQDKVTLAETVGLTRTNPDYYALRLGNEILGGGFYASWLYHDLRETSGLVYGVSTWFDVKKTRGTYRIDYGCDPPNVSRARTLAVQDLGKLIETPVDDATLNRAKGILLRQLPLNESSVNRIAYGMLHRSLLGLPLDEPTRAAKRYLALDARSVQAAFAKWVDPARLVQVTQGPAPK